MIDRARTVLAALAIAAFTATPLAAQTSTPPAPEAQPAPEAPEAAPPEPKADEAACGAKLERFIRSMSERFDGARLTNEAQRRAYDAFKTASAKALEFVREACANESSAANIRQLEAAEKQMAQALDQLRPALENFYASLSDEQKAQIDSLGRQLQLWAQDFWSDMVRDFARQLREHQAEQPGPRPDDLRFCFGGFCLSVPGDVVDGRRDRRWREPDNGERL